MEGGRPREREIDRARENREIERNNRHKDLSHWMGHGQRKATLST